MKTQFELYYLYSSRFFLLLAAAVAVVYYSVLVMSLLLPSLCCESITHIYVINTFWCWLLLFSHAKIEKKKDGIKPFNVNGKFSWISISDNQMYHHQIKTLDWIYPHSISQFIWMQIWREKCIFSITLLVLLLFFSVRLESLRKTSSIWNFNL